MKALAEIARDAQELPPEDRAKLASYLLDTLDADPVMDPEIEAAWDEEIARRMKAWEAGNVKTRTADEVFADLDKRFPG